MAYNIVATGATSNLFKIEAVNTAVNGVVHKILDTNVTLANAPTIYPYGATLTPEQIASGVIKHADASNSGLITNGKFDVDTSGWSGTNANISVVSGELKVASSIASSGYASQTFNTVIGKQYILEFDVYRGDSSSYTVEIANVGGTTHAGTSLVKNRVTITFTATATTHTARFYTNQAVIGRYCMFDNIAVFPADAISRSDLVFLESWHEDVSEKDFVYPLGNVQYLGTTGDSGTPVAGAFAGSATYSLFSDTWQADGALVGKGYVWSTLSDANKKAFVANPENNCYLDGDKVIQVRYRMRVVQGLGDSWANVSSISINGASGYPLRYGSFGTFNLDGTVKPKGKKVALINKDIDIYQNGMYLDLGNADSSYNKSGLVYIGAFCACNSAWEVDIAYGYEGKCFALPIALVHR